MFFTTGTLSEDANKSQTLVSQPQEEMNEKRAFTPIPTETPKPEEKTDPTPAEELKGEDKSKDSASEVKKQKKHNPVSHKHKTKAKEKHKREAPKAKEAPTALKDTKAEPVRSSSGHKGWFVGLRGAYVPAGILEIGYEFNATFQLRLLGEMGRYNRTYSVDGQRYDGIRIKPQKVGIMADWHPWKNGLRVSGGLGYNVDRIQLSHAVTGTLLGQPASVYGTITAKYKYRRAMAPYVGIGYDTGSLGDTGLSLSADAGFWFQGKVVPSVNLTGTGQSKSDDY